MFLTGTDGFELFVHDREGHARRTIGDSCSPIDG